MRKVRSPAAIAVNHLPAPHQVEEITSSVPVPRNTARRVALLWLIARIATHPPIGVALGILVTAIGRLLCALFLLTHTIMGIMVMDTLALA